MATRSEANILHSTPIPQSRPQNRPHSDARARRMGVIDPPISFSPSSPPVPARSPLRGTPRSINSFSTLLEAYPGTPPLSPSSLRSSQQPSPPPSPSASVPAITPPQVSKREHALKELLTSEQAFATDMRVVKEVHIPLARADVQFPISPPSSSGSSTRTSSTHSASSSTTGAPMSKEDIKIIFNNIEEIASFADVLTQRLEEALGSILPGGQGQDAVGALFIEILPVMTPIYATYITRHAAALDRLAALQATNSPAFASYVSQARELSKDQTNAWDLSSLLIKPVQRLLKYPLLLGTILDDTPATHSDKEALKEAREKLEEAARGVNEGKRRWEVVKDVLEGKAVRPGLNTIGRMRSLRMVGRNKSENDGSSDNVLDDMEKKLKKYDRVMRAFQKDASEWSRSVRATVSRLNAWIDSFWKVIALGDTHVYEALLAFKDVVTNRLQPLCNALDQVLAGTLRAVLSQLILTMQSPLLLLTTMHSLRTSHHILLNTPYNKSRPPAQLIEASASYVALTAQLKDELPKYLALLDRGFSAVLGQFSAWQCKFWEEVSRAWAELWCNLKLETDGSHNGEATVRIWEERWQAVEPALQEMSIINRQTYGGVYARSIFSKSSSSLAAQQHFPSSSSSHVGRPPSPSPSVAPSMVSVASNSSHRDHYRDHHRNHSAEIPNLPAPRIPYPKESSLDSFKEVAPIPQQPPPVPPKPLERRSSKSEKKHGEKKKEKSSKDKERSSKDKEKSSKDKEKSSKDKSHKDKSRSHANPTPSAPHPLHRMRSDPNPLRYVSAHGVVVPEPRDRKAYDDERGTTTRDHERRPSVKRHFTDTLRLSDGRSSLRSNTRLSDIPSVATSPTDQLPDEYRHPYIANGPMYTCTVVHVFKPPYADITYCGLPFLTLHIGDLIQILDEKGHPSDHPELPLTIDDSEAEDCLLVGRDEEENIGWVLASFLVPLEDE